MRLSAITIDAPPDAAPTTVKLFANRHAFTFDNIDTEPDALLRLDVGDLGKPVALRPAKFASVTSLHIFFERDEADVVAVSKLAFAGTVTLGGANVSNIKKIGEES